MSARFKFSQITANQLLKTFTVELALSNLVLSEYDKEATSFPVFS